MVHYDDNITTGRRAFGFYYVLTRRRMVGHIFMHGFERDHVNHLSKTSLVRDIP